MTTEEIPEGWKECKLGDVATIKTGKTNSVDAVVDGAYPLFDRSMNVKKSSKYLFDCEAVLVPGEGKEFAPRYYKGKFDLHQRTYAVIPNQQICDGRYCYYTLLNGRNYFSLVAVGSTVMSLRLSTFELFDILLPPLSEQRAIASVLSSLDNKIDMLHRENKTLEKMAEAIFRQWFIEEADEGWEECTLNDLCMQIASGGTPSTKIANYYDGDINWYSTKELNDGFLYESENKITRAGLDNSAAKLFSAGTVIIAIYAAPTVGRLGILANEASFNQAACGLVANEDICCFEFIYLFLKNQRNELNLMASGSAQQNLNVEKIKSYPSFKAPKELMNKFKEIIQPIFKKIKTNQQQIRTLERLRDTLLPKLMSGKVRVKI